MSEEQAQEPQVEETHSPVVEKDEDSTADAVSAVAIILLAVCIALYWVSGQ